MINIVKDSFSIQKTISNLLDFYYHYKNKTWNIK
jgi:hypothetical protein